MQYESKIVFTYKLVRDKQNEENEVLMDTQLAKSLLWHREGDTSGGAGVPGSGQFPPPPKNSFVNPADEENVLHMKGDLYLNGGGMGGQPGGNQPDMPSGQPGAAEIARMRGTDYERRYFTAPQETIRLRDGDMYVCSQWGIL